MIVGFNHNILYLGVGFHVQTEDGGLKSPNLVTLLYHGGIIVSSQKTSYADILGVDNLNQVVEDLAKEQHKGMLRRLTKGEFDQRIGELGIALEFEANSSPKKIAPCEKPAAVAEVGGAGGLGTDVAREEIERLEPIPLGIPTVARSAESRPLSIEPAFEPLRAEDRVQRQDVSEALDDLIFSYLTGGNEES